MLRHFITILLVGGILWGAVEFWSSSVEYWPVRSLYLPVAAEIRRFEPGADPDKYYVRCMVNKPLHLEWQFSLPSGLPAGASVYAIQYSLGAGGASSIRSESFARAVWTIDYGQEQAHLAMRTANTSSASTMDVSLAEFLRNHWDELDIKACGSDTTEAISGKELVTLLRIDIPPQLREFANRELTPGNAARLDSPILIVLGVSGLKDWKTIVELYPTMQSFVDHMK